MGLAMRRAYGLRHDGPTSMRLRLPGKSTPGIETETAAVVRPSSRSNLVCLVLARDVARAVRATQEARTPRPAPPLASAFDLGLSPGLAA